MQGIYMQIGDLGSSRAQEVTEPIISLGIVNINKVSRLNCGLSCLFKNAGDILSVESNVFVLKIYIVMIFFNAWDIGT